MKTVFVLAFSACLAATGAAQSGPTERTVHVTVTDDNRPVADLTPADFVVKEGGKEREIVKVERAATPLRVALAVEERLTVDSAVRMGLFEFMKRLSGAGELSLITIGLRNTTIVDYTNSLEALVGGINRFSLNPARESAVAEGVLELANRFIESKPPRPIMVVVAITGGQVSVQPRLVLDRIGQSGAAMYAVTLAGAGEAPGEGSVGSLNALSNREQVLGDGPKQSGGRRIDVPSTGAMPKALQQIADELQAQYAITYTVPAGVKLDKRFNASLKRRGLSLRAPSVIPDK